MTDKRLWAQIGMAIICVMTLSVESVQALEVSASVDRERILLNESLLLTVTVKGVTGELTQPELSNLNEWTLIASRRSQNLSFIQGQFLSEVTFTYQLSPHSAGQKTLGPITLAHDNQLYRTEPMTIEVLPVESSPSGSSPSPPVVATPAPIEPQVESKTLENDNRMLFAQAYVDRLQSYVNQQITLTIEYYSVIQILDVVEQSLPSADGFWVEELEPPELVFHQTIEGIEYRVAQKRLALFPKEAGQWRIGSGHVEVVIPENESGYRGDVLEPSAGSSLVSKTAHVSLTTEPITIEVLPLPEEGRPSIFQGDVGQFQMNASVTPSQARVGDTITLTLRIIGMGNIRSLSTPRLLPAERMTLQDMPSSERIIRHEELLQGEKVFTKVLIPHQAGQITIGPIVYGYFDPFSKRYQILETPPLRVSVLPEAKEASMDDPETTPPSVFDSASSQTVAQRPSDPLVEPLRKFIGQIQRKWLIYLGWLLAGITMGVLLRRIRRDDFQSQMRRALKMARQDLAAGRVVAFYENIQEALTMYLKILGVASCTTSKETQAALQQKGFDAVFIDQVISCLSSCEQARVAPLSTMATLTQETLRHFEVLVRRLKR